MSFINNIRTILAVLIAWAVFVILVSTSIAVLAEKKLELSLLLPSLVILVLFRWLWNGSTFARSLTVATCIAICLVAAVGIATYPKDLTIVLFAALTFVIWAWLGASIVFSSKVKAELSSHWSLLKSKDHTPSYRPTLMKGVLFGALITVASLGVGYGVRQLNSEHITQEWLDNLAIEVTKKAPKVISDWLVFTKLESGPRSLRYEYEVTNLAEGVTMNDAKRTIEETTTAEECDNNVFKQLIADDIEITRRYIHKPTNSYFDLSYSDICKQK